MKNAIFTATFVTTIIGTTAKPRIVSPTMTLHITPHCRRPIDIEESPRAGSSQRCLPAQITSTIQPASLWAHGLQRSNGPTALAVEEILRLTAESPCSRPYQQLWLESGSVYATGASWWRDCSVGTESPVASVCSCAAKSGVGDGHHRGNCHDNAVAESFLQLLKRERIKRRIYATRDPKRRHNSSGRLSPVNYEKQYFQRQQSV